MCRDRRAWTSPAWAALGFAACANPAPPAPAPQSAPLWALVGEVTLGEPRPGPLPGFQEANALLGPACATAAARLRAKPPPCRVELWRPLRPAGASAGDERALLLQVGGTSLLETAAGEIKRRARWAALGPVLDHCLQDPLALPPAGDPGGFRHLAIEGQETAWVLHLSGQNPCALSGVLRLGIAPDHVSVDDLAVEGLPWRDGGAERALALQRAAVRVEVRDHFLELPAVERIVGLESLVHDPDPEALAILEQIVAAGGLGSTDAARAIERRAHRQQEPP